MFVIPQIVVRELDKLKLSHKTVDALTDVTFDLKSSPLKGLKPLSKSKFSLGNLARLATNWIAKLMENHSPFVYGQKESESLMPLERRPHTVSYNCIKT